MSEFILSLSSEAIDWLAESVLTRSGESVSNFALFNNLLRRATPTACLSEDFRRPQMLQPGQFQFSEIGLSEDWNVGRKKVHNLLQTMQRLGLISVFLSRVASVATITCIKA